MQETNETMVVDDQALALNKIRDRVGDAELLVLSLANASSGLNEAESLTFSEVATLYTMVLYRLSDELEDIGTALGRLIGPAVVPRDADGPDASEPPHA